MFCKVSSNRIGRCKTFCHGIFLNSKKVSSRTIINAPLFIFPLVSLSFFVTNRFEFASQFTRSIPAITVSIPPHLPANFSPFGCIFQVESGVYSCMQTVDLPTRKRRSLTFRPTYLSSLPLR